MELFEALLWPECRPFSVALGLMVAIALLEGIGAFIGWSASAMLSSLFDADVPDADIAGETPGGVLSRTLGWLRIGRVPVLIGLVIALTVFGLAGLIAQTFLHAITGIVLSPWIAAPIVAVVTLPIVRALNGGVGKLMPGDETQAVSRGSFTGRTGIVTLGPATRTRAGQCRIHDRYGQAHYVMIEPDLEDERFETGDRVLLVREAGSRWRVIACDDIEP